MVKFYCSMQTLNHLMIATEYLPDHTLQTLVARRRNGVGLPKHQAAVLLAELATAINYLHENQVLHGNIRPENVRIDSEGHCRLAGFNYAQTCFPKHRTTVRPPPSNGGKSKHALSMMEFQSPELKSGLPHGQKTDWYSYGAVMLFAMTALHPPPIMRLDMLVWQSRSLIAPQLGEGGLDLLLCLVGKVPERRPDYDFIKRHQFFALLDWKDVENGEAASAIGKLEENKQVSIYIFNDCDFPQNKIFYFKISSLNRMTGTGSIWIGSSVSRPQTATRNFAGGQR